METRHRIAVITSGGDAPGMNAALRSVVRGALSRQAEVVGFYTGYDGLINDDSVKLGVHSVSGIINRGGTILHTARSADFLTEPGRAKAYQVLEKHQCTGLIILGGDGSFRGARDLSHEYKFPVIGVPTTIDNDVGGTDYTIGFDTAVNNAILCIDKIRDTAESHERVFVVEVMGRNRGFIAMEAALAGGAEGILVPEIKPDLPALAERLIKGHRRGKTSSIVVVSEGAGGADMSARPGEDELPRSPSVSISYHVADVIAGLTGLEVRVCVLGHIQRGGPPTAFDRSLASRLGAAAVDHLLAGTHDVMVGRQMGKIVITSLDESLKESQALDKKVLDLVERLGR
jgi:6-phosphofructokinase 1